MKIAFYVNPFVTRGDPEFYKGALLNKFIPQARSLQVRGHSIVIIASEFLTGTAQVALPSATIVTITQRDLSEHLGTTASIEAELYANPNHPSGWKMAEVIRSKISDPPDAVICWETPGSFLRTAFPNAVVIHEMPGVLSRAPFPELVTIDSLGLFRESAICRFSNEIRNAEPDPRAIELIADIRSDLLPFLESATSFTRQHLDPYGKFSKLVLLPLQVTDQYAFGVDSGYRSQMAFLLDVLTVAPPTVGVVVTQYVSKTAADRVLNADRCAELQKTYPNLIYDADFDRLDNVSQYLLPFVDGVVTISSSIGVQALLWNKSLITVRQSHLAGHASFASLNEVCAASERGEEYVRQADAVLAWMMTHHQPLASMLAQTDFFGRWIEKFSERGADNGIGDLPNFFDLEPDYRALVNRDFRRLRAGKLIPADLGQGKAYALEDTFARALQQRNPSFVSFDVFDTLIDRKVEQPHHVFLLLESDVEKISAGKLTNFHTTRQQVERDLRSSLLPGCEELTLAEIYGELQVRYELTTEQRDAIRQLELTAEFRFLGRRNAGHRLFQAAKARGVRVAFISDMYLPEEFVRAVLREAGYPSDIPLYLSSTYGLRKHQGSLFKLVGEREGIVSERWLHVGDNAVGDVAVPESLGIGAFRVPSATTVIERNKKLNQILKADRKGRTGAEAVLYGLAQRALFDDPYRCPSGVTHFGGSPFALGYMAVGPVLYGYLNWVMTQAKQDRVEKLFFLSRDGQVLWRMAQVLFPAVEGWPESVYVMSSRRAARVASLYTVSDIATLAESAIAPCTIGQLMLGKFGIEIDETDHAALEQAGFTAVFDRIGPGRRDAVRRLATSLSTRILANAHLERELLIDHYKEHGLDGNVRAAVVDIGYAGTMQVAIQKLMGCRDLFGYYYITFESALANRHRTGPLRGYAGEFVRPQLHGDLICRHGFLYETLFCSSECSFVCFRRDLFGNIIPRFDRSEEDNVRRALVAKVHEAVLILANHMRATFGSRVAALSISASTAARVLHDFVVSPSGRDAEMFEGCIFDDGFSGAEVRYIVPDRAQIRARPEVVARAIWEQGAQVFARRPDIKAQPLAVPPTPNQIHVAESASVDIEPAPVLLAKRNTDASNPERLRPVAARVERFFVRALVHSKHKLAKYERNRNSFFLDASGALAKLYWMHLGRRLLLRDRD